MKIIMVHVKYRQRGGEDAVFENEIKLLQMYGLDVIPVCFSNDDIQEKGVMNKIKLGLNTIWSREYCRLMDELLKKEKPDIVHFHNIFPLLSPSVYKACHDNKIPVVQTLHNYRWACPAGTFFRSGKTCELCLTNGLINSFKFGCYRGSKTASLAVVAMLEYAKLMNIFDKYVSKIIVLTQFAKNKITEAGLPVSKIEVKPNFLFGGCDESSKNDSYVLFIGRLSAEKGIGYLAEAMQGMPKNIRVKVAGDGPYYDEIKRCIEEKNINMELLRSLDRKALSEAIAASSLVVIPSQCYEGFPMAVLDAYSHGKPVLVSRIGGLPELVEPGQTGRVFGLDNIASLRDSLIEMMADSENLSQMGKNAYRKFQEEYSAQRNFSLLIDIYQSVIRC